MDTKNPVLRAIDAAGGSVGKLAKQCGVSYQAVQRWRAQGRVPAERVLSIERITGISRHELRPDIYPPEEYGVEHAQ